MQQVLVIVARGIIEEVVFFNDPAIAIKVLSKYAKAMNVEHDDVALYDRVGLVANAKHFLDDNDAYIENKDLIEKISKARKKIIYIIANPIHRLGFMVASPDDPIGYDDPVAVLSNLGQMRQDYGNHLRLYEVIPVDAYVPGCPPKPEAMISAVVKLIKKVRGQT